MTKAEFKAIELESCGTPAIFYRADTSRLTRHRNLASIHRILRYRFDIETVEAIRFGDSPRKEGEVFITFKNGDMYRTAWASFDLMMEWIEKRCKSAPLILKTDENIM
ncbi:hypothetical protein K9N68_37445 (plasmid) [Kovacikia minuta CCNUW1]|uniref:hypothetical protein n=1 Tax=Kovacikia minuta TaxID=2931930 RepID=UPI001CC96A3F|nr:hypothetical protein [Kovacikia minuta]UBF29899.1 hypothetical protein K9N68_37445 [Kovacikia minuta CCNUW1]